MRIDAHQHFWAIERGDYGWLTPKLTTLYCDFGPKDLAPLLESQGIDGTVLVQAAPTVAETRYMLGLADQTSFVKGVVGWVNFANPETPAIIAELAAHPKLVGLRPMIQDIADDDWMLKEELTPAFQAVIEASLVFDALTLPRHLENLLKLIERHANLRVVIDHGSKPQIGEGLFDDWAKDIATLASETSAHMKLSGLVTEAGEEWDTEKLRPYVDHLLDHFGPDRIIWGSDWPVCTLASSYERWCDATDNLLSGCTLAEREAILGRNAVQVYGLALP